MQNGIFMHVIFAKSVYTSSHAYRKPSPPQFNADDLLRETIADVGAYGKLTLFNLTIGRSKPREVASMWQPALLVRLSIGWQPSEVY